MTSTTEVRSVAGGFELDGVVGGQPAVGVAFEAFNRCAFAVCGGPVAQDVAAVKGAGVVGDAAGGGHRFRGLGEVWLDWLAGDPPVEHGRQLVLSEAVFGGAGFPLLAQFAERPVV